MNPSTAAAAGPATSAFRRWISQPWVLAPWCIVAAFGAYGCMYGFRKPFTAGTYTDTDYGTQLKAWLVTAQILGYTLAKFIGIKVISEMPPARRARTLLGLVGLAQAALLLFAVLPAPYNAAALFLNGLPLGMVFGLVLGFLEGRRLTELFVAGLCASFILADGVTKTVGAWLLRAGVTEAWMPFAAGALFLTPLVVFVWMLQQIPPPDHQDVIARSERTRMTGRDRLLMLRRHGPALLLIVLAYLLITILRSFRADFAPEIWAGLGAGRQPAVFTLSEMWVALGVIGANGLLVLVRDNRRALLLGLGLSVTALGLAAASLALVRTGHLQPFPFMVLLGLGMYVPYVAVHTTVFERLVALTRAPGNIGFLMYLADAVGYLGYAGTMLARSAFRQQGEILGQFLTVSAWLVGGALVSFVVAGVVCARKHPASPRPAGN